MSVFRYMAIPLTATTFAEVHRGELAGESAAEVRASLRRIGLQVIDLRPIRSRGVAVRAWELDAFRSYLRRRRLPERAELYDSLAMMLESGTPLASALDTILEAQANRGSRLRTMVLELREGIRGGASLATALRAHPSWFEPVEVAMVEAAEHAGTLPRVLRSLAERSERATEIGQKLAGALMYPTVVAVVGIGALLFLSTKTLPELARILQDAKVEVPVLTARVMAFGQLLVRDGVWILGGLAMLAAGGIALRGALVRRGVVSPSWLRRLVPAVARKTAVASFARGMAELLRSGVPAVDALRVLAPTARSAQLRRTLESAAQRVERGEDIARAMEDRQWFDPEFRRLLEIGQASGELESLLDRLGQRYERKARRAIDRLTALLEPAVILVLASLIGIVVMAAVLPMIRLQEILR